jgi:hypothetical protein
MDYSEIMAVPSVGREIGRLYMEASPVVTPLARIAYHSFACQVDAQYREMRKSIKVEFTGEDPYVNALAMFEDVRSGWLRVWMTQPEHSHPVLTMSQNNRFRAVHDFHGHFMTGRGFDRHGEEAAWVRHSRMFSGLGRRAMTTETRGQSSAFIWVNRGERFPAQKAVLLPEWVSE